MYPVSGGEYSTPCWHEDDQSSIFGLMNCYFLRITVQVSATLRRLTTELLSLFTLAKLLACQVLKNFLHALLHCHVLTRKAGVAEQDNRHVFFSSKSNLQ